MYPPPPPPQPYRPPARQRHGMPAFGVVLVGLGCLLAGCIGGAAIASSPDPGTPAAASSSTTATPAAETTGPAAPKISGTESPRRRTVQPTPKRTTAEPRPKRTTAKPRPKPRKTTRAPSTDPRYPTCTAAKRHGLGPYVRGTDPEYAWYEDRDHDGVVCE
ncbi:excalibur calcium-binding domain-containing protein [Actinomadura monticuli]|uniref:Excalibur calcium-binding domain-containing protein n=1 Tax=Actinomadura monticuli TaxID=3097367 RepID=A0ABV4QD00_9ACTN